MNTPINSGLLQSDVDFAGFKPLNADLSDYALGGGDGTDRKFDVKTYGATGDGATDDTTAIEDALTAIPAAGGVLYFPAGIYKYAGSTLTLDRQITVLGDGGGITFVTPPAGNVSNQPSISTIDFNSSTGTLFTVTDYGCMFRDIGLRNTSSTVPSAGAGIVVSSSGDRTRYENISIDGFYIGIDVQAGSAHTFEGCWIAASVLYGLKFRNVAVPDGGDHFVDNCYICGLDARNGTAAIRIESGGGVKICNTKINASGDSAWLNGIDLAVGSGIVTVDLLISNCSVEGFTGNGIKCTTGSGAIWKSIVITGNQISPYRAGNIYGIFIDGTGGTLEGITLTGNHGIGPGGLYPFISLSNCTKVVQTGNGQVDYSGLITLGSGVTFADSPVYIGRDARLAAVSGGVKLECRNTGTDIWVEAARWTNP